MLPVGCRCKPLQNAVTCQNSAPAVRAEYCDERVCLLVCLSVCLHAYAKNHSSGITIAIGSPGNAGSPRGTNR